jgi:hypothetical protein
MPQLITLISRILTRETKSSTGIISKLNSGEYGSKSVFDVGLDFLVNKTTPPASTVIAWTRGRDFSGKKPTLGKTAFRFLPISVQNFIELKDEKTAIAVIGAFIDLLGVSTNTYSQETDWGESTGKELLQFKEKVGEEKFKEANDLFNEMGIMHTALKEQEFALLDTAEAERVRHSIRQAKSYIPPFVKQAQA